MRGYTELFCLKAASGLPLENFINITWGLGRVRTNAIPLDRREPPDHLGTWSRLNQSCLLIGLRPQNHLGVLVEPEPLPCHLVGINATVSFGDLADLNHSYTYRELGRVRPW